MVVIGLGKNLLFKSVLAHCARHLIHRASCLLQLFNLDKSNFEYRIFVVVFLQAGICSGINQNKYSKFDSYKSMSCRGQNNCTLIIFINKYSGMYLQIKVKISVFSRLLYRLYSALFYFSYLNIQLI